MWPLVWGGGGGCQTLRTVLGLERDWLLLLGSIHGARLRRSPTWRRSFGDVCLSRSNRDGATSLSNRYRARRVLDGFGSPRSLHLSRRDIILHPFSPILFFFFLSFFFSFQPCSPSAWKFSFVFPCDCAIRSGLRKDTMAKDSLETSDQFKMVEIRDDRQTRQQKSVEQDREDLARMGKKQVLKVRPKCPRVTHVHSKLNRCRGNLA